MTLGRSPAVLLVLALAACGGETDPAPPTTSGPDAATPEGVRFRLRIANVSNLGPFATPITPGVWATHLAPNILFEPGTPDRGEGLELLAEAGGSGPLAKSLARNMDVYSSGAWRTPRPTASPDFNGAPAFPQQYYEAIITATPEFPRLSLATMLAQTNDVFVAPAPEGIRLFDDQGRPLPERDITEQLELWNCGTEVDEAPGMGPNQAPREVTVIQGAQEGVVRAFTHPTRALPLPSRIVDVDVARGSGEYTITITNVSADRGAIVTPIAPVFWATHDASWRLFRDGAPAGPALELLAEEGSPADLVAAHTGAAGTGRVGAQTMPEETPGMAGPAMPGQRYRFTVPADPQYPWLTFATMVVESNDAFIAPPPAGIRLFSNDATQSPRSAAELEADIAARLALWDAGTEANEVPGVGPSMPLRAHGVGRPDGNPNVRRYIDPVNDLCRPTPPSNQQIQECLPGANGFVRVDVTRIDDSGRFSVQVTNTSSGAFPGVLTPVVWAVHRAGTPMFTPGAPASAALTALAEAGETGPLVAALERESIVSSAGFQGTHTGTAASGPIHTGGSYTFTVAATQSARFLSIASMIVPSNDTFVAFEPEGVALLDSRGTPRSDAEIAADVQASLRAWDAGTEENQAGAAGPDQPPRQGAVDVGPEEGDGTVRREDHPVWSFPPLSLVIRATLTPLDGEDSEQVRP